jgi:hypothetical protein
MLHLNLASWHRTKRIDLARAKYFGLHASPCMTPTSGAQDHVVCCTPLSEKDKELHASMQRMQIKGGDKLFVLAVLPNGGIAAKNPE